MKFKLRMLCAIIFSFALGMALQAARGSSETKNAARVTGVGGFFFKSENPAKLADWYHAHLGIALVAAGKSEHAPQFYAFHWREKDHPETIGSTAFSIFPASTKYFEPSTASFMMNLRVANLEQLLAQLKTEGVKVDDKIDNESNGKFAYVLDPDGNRIELWEPKGE
jgi:catechol 2,3-dioxygenase-like lactoylglutathione lyase family enzyme